MKLTRTLIFVAAVASVLAAGTPIAAAQTYLGEFCWSLSEHHGSGNAAVGDIIYRLRAGVTHLGGRYYLVQGEMGGFGAPLLLQATGVVVGDVLWLSGTTTEGRCSFQGGVCHAGIMQLALNFSTSGSVLWGGFWRLQTDIVSPDGLTASFSQRYITGGVSFLGSCP